MYFDRFTMGTVASSRIEVNFHRPAGASLSCLAQALHWLVHSAPLSATARCAEYRHDGALASLRSLSISVAASAEAEGRDEEELLLGESWGRPGCLAHTTVCAWLAVHWIEGVLGKGMVYFHALFSLDSFPIAGRLLAAFVAAAPCLVRLEVQGLTSAAANDAICAAWHVRFSGTEASTLMDAAGTLHLSSGSAQESSAASRAPCQHMLPSPSTPPAGAFGDHQALGSAATEVGSCYACRPLEARCMVHSYEYLPHPTLTYSLSPAAC